MNKKNSKHNSRGVELFRKISDFFHNDVFLFITGLFCALVSFYLLIALTSFLFTGGEDQSLLDAGSKVDLTSTENGAANYGGSLGARISNFLVNDCFGLSSYILVLFVLVSGIKLMRIARLNLQKWFICCSFLSIWLSIFMSFAFSDILAKSFISPGGMHGRKVTLWIISQIGALGLVLVLLVTLVLFLIYLSKKTIGVIRNIFHLPPLPKIIKEENTGNDIIDNKAEEKKDFLKELLIDDETASPDVAFTESYNENVDKDKSENEETVVDDELENEEIVHTTNKPADNNEPEFTIEETPREEDDYIPQEPYNPKLDLEYYKYPNLKLLNSYDDKSPAIDMEEQNANKVRIVNVLRNFGIEISSIKATVGPTITLYEITPASGVRISKIRNLEDDIALSLSALGIRIIAPIPGKGTIGIEVPNAKKLVVSMQSVLDNKKYQESTFELPVALGRTITNEVFMVDLTKMPHLLVAGATGMGKSVGLNALITSLLYKKHPAELKFVMIDPKKVEFSIYEPIEKHFLAKLSDGEDAIITDVTKVVQTLKSLCLEMDNRYDLLKKAHVRTIKDYNDKFINRQLNPNKGHKYMPYIVVIIDEFGDLIMTAGKEIELPIARIAQLARAVGIHMVIATQRPTTNIITGTIKANFPARMAFRVAAMMDSRTILDRPGANQLIGRGDMLFLTGSDPVRVQCAFVDTPEVERVCEFISKQQSYPSAYFLPEYVGDESDNSTIEVDMDKIDPMLEDAARLIVIHQQGSTSLIQRKFSIGYNRAGRIMDQLEKAGIVGPAEGSKARQVLCMDEADLEFRLNSILKR